MSKTLRVVLCAVTAAGAAAYVAVQPPPDRLVLRHATIMDGVTCDVRRDMTVVSGAAASRVCPARRPSSHVTQLFSICSTAGFCQASSMRNVHFRDLASARAALAAGVTTARSLGVDQFADIGIRELHRAGASDVPDALAAG
jgi:hypothetical protein